MSADPTDRVAGAMRTVAMRLQEAFETGEVARIDAIHLAEILLSIAEELDPPLPKLDPSIPERRG